MDDEARDGNREAQFKLGLAFEEGRGVPRNVEKAKVYYSLAARAGDEAISPKRFSYRARQRLDKIQNVINMKPLGDPVLPYTSSAFQFVRLFASVVITGTGEGLSAPVEKSCRDQASASPYQREMITEMCGRNERVRVRRAGPTERDLKAGYFGRCPTKQEIKRDIAQLNGTLTWGSKDSSLIANRGDIALWGEWVEVGDAQRVVRLDFEGPRTCLTSLIAIEAVGAARQH